MKYSSSKVPFPHLVFDEVYCKTAICSLFRRLRDCGDWKERSHPLFAYATYDVSAVRDEGCMAALEPRFLRELRRTLERGFDVRLQAHPTVQASRLVDGQGVGLHSDEGEAGVVFVSYISPHWTPETGGFMVLCETADVGSANAFVPPKANTGIAFAPGEGTFHGVTNVRRFVRYAVAYRFSTR